jgi:hypothetical protein
MDGEIARKVIGEQATIELKFILVIVALEPNILKSTKQLWISTPIKK